MPTDKAVELLLQVPMVGVVIITVFIFMRHIEKSDIRQQEFIKEQREDNNSALKLLAEEIKSLALSLGK
jgi:hypothetical protein